MLLIIVILKFEPVHGYRMFRAGSTLDTSNVLTIEVVL